MNISAKHSAIEVEVHGNVFHETGQPLPDQ